MNVLEILKSDHEAVDRLFSAIQSTPSADRAKREKLFGTLKETLIKHAHAEEKVFYPPLHERQSAHDLIEEGIHEHHSMEERIQRMAGIPADSDDWMDEVAGLKECVQHHVQEEETEIFPKARQLLGEQALDDLAGKVQEAKEAEGPV